MQKKQKILVVAAHPDDEVLGCGGTAAKYSKENDVYIAILGEGISSRYEKREQAEKSDLGNLQNQARKAAKIIGAKECFLFGLPDNRFDTVPMLEIVKKIEEIIKKTKPEIIFTHHSGDLNIDHRITFQAVLTSARPLPGSPVKKIYSFEIPSSTEWSQQKIEKPFLPNFYEDVSGTLDKKIEAIKVYESEAREFPHPRSAEGLKVLAQKRGMEAGIKFAEAFELIREVK